MVRREVPSIVTAPIGAIRDVPDLMEALGQDPWPLLEEHGINAVRLSERHSLVPASLLGKILKAAAIQTGCPHFGLMVGEAATFDNVGELRFLALNASSARQAVDHLIRFIYLLHPILRVSSRKEQGYTCFSLTLSENLPGAEQMLQAYTASFVGALRAVMGSMCHPSAVNLAMRKPTSIARYKDFFRAPVQFNQPDYAILFPDEMLDRPRKEADPRLAQLIFDRLCELEAHVPTDLVGQVRHAIETQLLYGNCNVVSVARCFAVHRKTLHGYLSHYHTSFETLLDETRKAMADRMLEYTDLSLSEIATALCYSNQAGLTRAFRRWHGASPSQWRRSKVQEGLATRRATNRYKVSVLNYRPESDS